MICLTREDLDRIDLEKLNQFLLGKGFQIRQAKNPNFNNAFSDFFSILVPANHNPPDFHLRFAEAIDDICKLLHLKPCELRDALSKENEMSKRDKTNQLLEEIVRVLNGIANFQEAILKALTKDGIVTRGTYLYTEPIQPQYFRSPDPNLIPSVTCDLNQKKYGVTSDIDNIPNGI